MECRLLIGLLVAVALGVQGECPADFAHLEEGCYHFSQDPLVREEAATYCLGLGAALAEFDTCADFSSVVRALDVAGFAAGSFWTGAIRSADIWAWESSAAPLVYGAPYWDPFVMTSDLSDCAVMSSKGSYLQPADCTTPAFPMCEAPVVKKTAEKRQEAPKVECPDPFAAVGDRCFYINPAFQTWEKARQTCQEIIPGTLVDLAVLNNCNLFTDVVRYLEESETGVSEWLWIGANDYQDTGVFRWISGEFISPGVPFWCPGQPNNFGAGQNCAMLWGSNFYYGADEDCTAVHRSLCEIGV